jgi:ribosomal protein S18 acetylase RimI-like enzyme
VDWKYIHDKSLILHRLAIHPKHQKQGIARKMMAFYEDYAVQNGFKTIRFDTFSENPAAMNLYKSLGYNIPGYVNFKKGKFWVFEKQIS